VSSFEVIGGVAAGALVGVNDGVVASVNTNKQVKGGCMFHESYRKRMKSATGESRGNSRDNAMQNNLVHREWEAGES
jgi:hypothetical protein